MFWFKKKKIVVDCFTPFKSVYELYKIDRAITFFPEEVKILPNYYSIEEPNTKISYEAATIRKCIGLQELYKVGYILPMWTDFICDPISSSQSRSAVALMHPPFYYNVHDKTQWNGFFDNHIHVKLASPWKIVEKSGVKFTWSSPTWNLHKHIENFSVVPGIVTYDYQSDTNVNIFVNKTAKKFTIDSGTPMAHMTPISDGEVVLKNHLISAEEHAKIGIPSDFSALRPERYLRWKNENKKAKCPFGFGK
jgi:hypothetical protein